MKNLFLFSLMLIALHYSAVGQSVLIQPSNSGFPSTTKVTGTIYGDYTTTQGNANLWFSVNAPASGATSVGLPIGNINADGSSFALDATASKNLVFRTATSGTPLTRMYIGPNGNVGINWTDPKARLEIYQTSPIVSSGWGGYVGNLKASAFFNGTHATLNENYDAIGIASHGNWANYSLGIKNIGILGTAGNTAVENIGVYGYVNQSTAEVFSSINGLYGRVQQGGNGSGIGVNAAATGNGSGYAAAMYATVNGTGTGIKYGIYASASGSGTKYAGYFDGNVYVSGSVTATAGFINSDQRLKHKFTSLENSLTGLSQLNGYHYYWKDQERSQTLQTGLIAQEVEKLFPELIQKDEKGFLSVNYVGLIPHLIEAIKELKTENASLQADINEIKGIVAKLAKNESESVPAEGKK